MAPSTWAGAWRERPGRRERAPTRRYHVAREPSCDIRARGGVGNVMRKSGPPEQPAGTLQHLAARQTAVRPALHRRLPWVAFSAEPPDPFHIVHSRGSKSKRDRSSAATFAPKAPGFH